MIHDIVQSIFFLMITSGGHVNVTYFRASYGISFPIFEDDALNSQ